MCQNTSMRQYASSPRKVDTRRLQGIAEGANSAPRLASSSAASFPGRNECPGTPCSLIEQEREDSSCQICHRVWDERTERESDNRRRGRLVGAAEISKEHAEWRRLQWINLSILGLPKRKKGPQCHRVNSWQECQTRPCQKEKEQAHQSRSSDREVRDAS